MAMNPKIKTHWIKALRSGDYEQGTQCLAAFKLDSSEVIEFCCLGVLCELAVKAGIVERPSPRGKEFGYQQPGDSIVEYNFLPQIVMDWAGLSDSDPVLGKTAASVTCSVLNDRRRNSFAQIADAIDKHL